MTEITATPSVLTEAPLDSNGRLGLFSALVIGVAEGRATVRLLNTLLELGGVRSAVVGYTPSAGDRVLVQVLENEAYLTGVLHTRGQLSLRAEGGAQACLDAAANTFRIENAEGRVVCEFDAKSGRLVVHSGAALEVTAPTAELQFDVKRVAFAAERVEVRAKEFCANVERASWRAERWELEASRLAEKARDKLVDIENSLQTRAGRVRALVSQTWELVSQRTRMVSKDDTSIDGKRILLG